MESPKDLVCAIDQGTSNSRVLIFSCADAGIVTEHKIEMKTVYPKEGWVEQDPMDILDSVRECISTVSSNLRKLNLRPTDIKAIGITNQRESTIVWDKVTGQPLYNCIVWSDIRTASTVSQLLARVPSHDKDCIRPRCGLPVATYFSAVKLRWLLDNCPQVQEAVTNDRCLFGTVDSWIIWNLTGGVNGGRHITDMTNASRTMLMNLGTLEWDEKLCRFFDVPISILPEIRSSSEIYASIYDGPFAGLPISGILGDQQSALFGQRCFNKGDAKNTYGTGCFLLYNTGHEIVHSNEGLLTTVAYKMGPDQPAVYALEGSVAIAGASVRWLRDNLGIILKSSDVEDLASSVDDTHGCYFVPAFSGLFCPYWQNDARGIICGLTEFTTKAHIARATLEAVCFQTREILEAMRANSGVQMTSLRVDGGMTANDLLMQIQANILGIPVVRPSMAETTALGVAMAAGCAQGIGVWDLKTSKDCEITEFKPSLCEKERDYSFGRWKKAVQRSMYWAELDSSEGTAKD